MNDDNKVMVVDDHPDAAEALATLLQLQGYCVRTVCDAVDALAAIEAFAPMCVLLDICMPALDGHELARQLRQRHGDEIVLIAVTGLGDPDERVTNRFEQFDHYLRKPIEAKLLQQLLPPLNALP